MDEADWLNSTEPQAMLAFLQASGMLSERKARLFAVACCRRIWHLLTDERSRKAVDAAEMYADGAIDPEAFQRACEVPNKPRVVVSDFQWPEGWRVADFVSFDAAVLVSDVAP